MKLTVLRLLLKRILLLIQAAVLITLIMLITQLILIRNEQAEPEPTNKKPNRTEPNRSIHAFCFGYLVAIHVFLPSFVPCFGKS